MWDENETVGNVLSRIKNQYRDFLAGIQNRKIDTVDKLLEILFVSKVLHILPKCFESFKSGYLLLNSNKNKQLSELGGTLIMHERNVNPTDQATTPEVLFTRVPKNRIVKSVHADKTESKSVIKCKYCGHRRALVKTMLQVDQGWKTPRSCCHQ